MYSLLGAAVASAILQILFSFAAVSGVSWEEWWTYDGISGPAFWGLINPEWSLCNKGRRQSPVNLEPEKLLFDPNLRFLHIDKHRINGLISNTGHSVIFTVENETRHHINITGGPLSYKYQFHEIHIHYGLHDQFGSEHAINGYSFPAEIQIFGFNSQLYSNFSEALHKAQGIVSISLLLQLGDLSNPELRVLTEELENIKYGGAEMPVNKLSVRGLLPDTDYYMTYDGSTTAPACFETVTWVVINKPIYITKQQLRSREIVIWRCDRRPDMVWCMFMRTHEHSLREIFGYVRRTLDSQSYINLDWLTNPYAAARTIFISNTLHGLRRLMQGDAKHPKAPLGNNFRPPQPLHHRAVRTNIDFDFTKYPGKTCPSMHRDMHYKAKIWTQY